MKSWVSSLAPRGIVCYILDIPALKGMLELKVQGQSYARGQSGLHVTSFKNIAS